MPASLRVSADRSLLLRLVEEGYRQKAWHGPNLKGAIRRVSPDQAAWRPCTGRHNIAEIVVHCAYWKYAVRRRVRGDKRGSFSFKGSNWFSLPAALTDGHWRDYVKLLDGEHRKLCEALTAAPWQVLVDGEGKTLAPQIHGIALHDVYHAGQIQTIKAMYRQAHHGS